MGRVCAQASACGHPPSSADLTYYPSVLVGADWVCDLPWVPGNLGPLAVQPFMATYTFGQYLSDPNSTPGLLFAALYELGPYYVARQVADPDAQCYLVLQAHMAAMTKAAGNVTLSQRLYAEAFAGYLSSIELDTDVHLLEDTAVGVLRLNALRVQIASDGAKATALESLFKQYSARLLFRFPSLLKLLDGASSVALVGFVKRLHAALPLTQRTATEADVLQLWKATDAALAIRDHGKLDETIAKYPAHEGRVAHLEEYLAKERAASGGDGVAVGGDGFLAVSHAAAPPSDHERATAQLREAEAGGLEGVAEVLQARCAGRDG